MTEFVTAFSLILVVYAYLGYPVILWLLLQIRGERKAGSAAVVKTLPPLTVIITARNEGQRIRQKIEDTLALSYGEMEGRAERLQIIVASDASDDETNSIVSEFAARGVQLANLPVRGGKEKAQGYAVQYARGKIILFTDVKIRLNASALENVVRYFEDETVGAVSSVDNLEGAAGEGLYVRYEMWLRRLESRFHSLVGLSGSCFAVRNELCAEWRTDVPSDFALLLATQRKGLRGVHADDVVGTYSSVQTEEEEFERKVRTVLRGITTFFSRTETLDPYRYGVFSWQIASHKLARWLVPWAFLLFGLGSLALASTSTWYSLCALGFLAVIGAATLGFVRVDLRKHFWCKVPLFFVLSNAAIAVAWIQYLTGKRAVVWNPSNKV